MSELFILLITAHWSDTSITWTIFFKIQLENQSDSSDASYGPLLAASLLVLGVSLIRVNRTACVQRWAEHEFRENAEIPRTASFHPFFH